VNKYGGCKCSAVNIIYNKVVLFLLMCREVFEMWPLLVLGSDSGFVGRILCGGICEFPMNGLGLALCCR
jgi:hypothetical protein